MSALETDEDCHEESSEVVCYNILFHRNGSVSFQSDRQSTQTQHVSCQEKNAAAMFSGIVSKCGSVVPVHYCTIVLLLSNIFYTHLIMQDVGDGNA